MERKFKFEVGQYVKIADRILEINKNLPKYPCKINYRFFDGNEIFLTSSAMITKTKNLSLREI